MVELKVLQAVRLKGEVSPADLAATVDEDAASVAQAIAAGTEA
ncbi:MAG TPA: MarR family transcriptional regulator, partial [Mycobacterium sp.]|nr:MarR family transcriptional regulator [Mycobacterium sp.]